MKNMIKLIISTSLIFILTVSLIGCNTKKDTVVIGSKDFNEQLILGNMIASMIEKNTNIKVEKKLNLGGTNIAFEALKSGKIDMYVEYTGTGLVNIMKKESISDSEQVYNAVKDYFYKEYKLSWLQPLGFNNTYTLSVRKDTAEKYHLETFSDLAKVSDQLILGSTLEFNERPDGYPGVKAAYTMNFKDSKPVNSGLRYNALENGKSDVIDAFSTDGLLKAFDLKVLKDDKNFFPPYYAVPLVRNVVLEKYPEIQVELDKLSNQITDEEMREMNYRVDKLNEDPTKIADEFLKSKGLIK